MKISFVIFQIFGDKQVIITCQLEISKTTKTFSLDSWLTMHALHFNKKVKLFPSNVLSHIIIVLPNILQHAWQTV